MNYQVEIQNAQDQYQDTSKKVERTEKKLLKETEENLRDSNSNVNDLVGQLKTREHEIEELEKNNGTESKYEEKRNKQVEINQLS